MFPRCRCGKRQHTVSQIMPKRNKCSIRTEWRGECVGKVPCVLALESCIIRTSEGGSHAIRSLYGHAGWSVDSNHSWNRDHLDRSGLGQAIRLCAGGDWIDPNFGRSFEPLPDCTIYRRAIEGLRPGSISIAISHVHLERL